MAEQLERRAERTPARFDLGYAPAPEATDHVKIRADHGLLIGGHWVAPASDRYFKTINPATEEVLAEVAEAGDEDVEAAELASDGGHGSLDLREVAHIHRDRQRSTTHRSDRGHQIGEFFVLEHFGKRCTFGVQHLAAERQNCLTRPIAPLFG